MRIKILLFILLINNITYASCRLGDAPSIIHPMENWDVVAGNSAAIRLAPSFSGVELNYSFKAKNKNQNSIKLNPHNGVMIVKAVTKDNFDVVVTAKNHCGSTEMKFNVLVDEKK